MRNASTRIGTAAAELLEYATAPIKAKGSETTAKMHASPMPMAMPIAIPISHTSRVRPRRLRSSLCARTMAALAPSCSSTTAREPSRSRKER